MKCLRLSLLVLLSVSLFSCSKKDDSAKPSNQLIGKWKMTEFTYSGSSISTYEGQSTTAPFSGTGKDMDLHLFFSENPNKYISNGDYTIQFTMAMEDQEVTQDVVIQGFMGSGSWTRDGNKINTTNAETGQVQTCTITQLDEHTLKMLWGGTLVTTESYGVKVVVTVNGIYLFERE